MDWCERKVAVDIVEYFQIRYPNSFGIITRRFGKDRNFFQHIKHSGAKKIKEETLDELCNMIEWYEVMYGNKKYTDYY